MTTTDNIPDDKRVATIAAVLDYLKASEWSVTRTSLYRHRTEGKLAPRSDGQYALWDVEKYARTWLKQKSTGGILSRDQHEEIES